jgi:exosortase F-associated protein
MAAESRMYNPTRTASTMLLTVAILVLVLMYIFQRVNFLHYFLRMVGVNSSDVHPYASFIFNKTLRLLLNDLACLLAVLVVFREQRYLRATMIVFLIELLLILPVYFWIKLSWEGDSEISSPLLSQIHRLVVNPILMILLMVGFFYQRFKQSR